MVQVKGLVKKFSGGRITGWIDTLSFPKIFLLWMLIIVSFGFMYYSLSNEKSYLVYTSTGMPVAQTKDPFYFSFFTGIMGGFNDILPMGYFKPLAVTQVLLSLLMIAIVTSKLVSIKQGIILDELYEFSNNERVNKTRSSMLLFRQNLDRVMTRLEEKIAWKREINGLYAYFSSFEDTLNEATTLLKRPGTKRFIRGMDPVNAHLVLNSAFSSMDKIGELLAIVNQARTPWKTENNRNSLRKCMKACDNLFNAMTAAKVISDVEMENLVKRRDEVMSKIKVFMDKPEMKKGQPLHKYFQSGVKTQVQEPVPAPPAEPEAPEQ